MTHSFHANQYENAYNPTRMSNWAVPKSKEYTAKLPKFQEGSTSFIANDRGYLNPGVPRSKKSPWGTFMGTWDMPHHIPNPYIHTTARHPEAVQKLMDQVKASPLNHVSNGFVPHALFPHCREKSPMETDEERCRRLQSSLPVSPQPPQGEEAPAQPDSSEGEKETLPHKLMSPVSLEPCPGSLGQAGTAARSGSGTRPRGPLPQQYPSGAEPASRLTSPGGTEKVRVCPQRVAQPLQEMGSRSEGRNSPDGQHKCKSPLIG